MVDTRQRYPVGVVPRVEAQPSHREFVQAVEPRWICLKIYHAQQLLRRGETADSWTPPNTRVVTTSTINDERLSVLTWEREREIVERFEPDAHIPTDVSVYPDRAPATRVEQIQKCMRGVIYMSKNCPDVQMIPLIKGLTTAERGCCYEAIHQIEAPLAAVYATRNYTGKDGGGFDRLQTILRYINAEFDANVFVIGWMSPWEQQRSQLPENVVACAGFNGWFSRVSLEDSVRSVRDDYYNGLQPLNDTLAEHAGVQPENREQGTQHRPETRNSEGMKL